MPAALQIVPAGARHVGGNIYQLPRRRHLAGRGKHHLAGKKKKSWTVGLFKRQWVWYAIALALADAIGTIILPSVAPWVSVPAVLLFAYGQYAKKPGAKNAALAIQGAHMLAYWGVTGMVRALAQQRMAGAGIAR